MSFAVRGVVEGFYGSPWSHTERLAMIDFLGACGMNAYVYAPKDEPKHRREWREPYRDDERREFEELAASGARAGVRVGFAISPGLDVDYDLDADRAALVGKCASMLDAGITWFLLALDDIPMRAGLAAQQGALANMLLERLRARDARAELFCCPTEYLGITPSPYLTALHHVLAPDIDLVWTGPTVCSRTITANEARSWRSPLGDRGLVLWDNVPVNDGTMESRLHLGPYEGRESALAGELRGVLCNPMSRPRASRVTLATAAEFLADPAGYQVDAAWDRALEHVGGAAFAPFLEACADGPMRAPEDLALAQLVDELDTECDGPGWIAALETVATHLRAARDAADALAERAQQGDPLAVEVAPWSERLRAEASAGLQAARLLQQCHPVAVIHNDGVARAVAPDPERVMQQAFATLFAWTEARRSEHVVFGPRFAIYPAIVAAAGTDGTPALDAAAAVVEDANAIDRLCRLALAAADDWRTDPDRALRVFVDGAPRAVDASGAFDAQGTTVLVRAGRGATRVGPGTTLPFREGRLA